MSDIQAAHGNPFQRALRPVLLCAALLWVGEALAADAALNWASLSGEQQYILAGFAARWPKLDMAARRDLLARAEAQSLRSRAASATRGASAGDQTADKGAASFKPTQRRRSLSVAEAGLSAHSLRLRRALRDLPGLSVNERRTLLERWGGLTGTERLALVDRYMHNDNDDDALSLEEALRNGSISKAELARGLSSGKFDASVVKEALANGSLSARDLKNSIATHEVAAEDVERVMREGKIESESLSNAIEHNRAPASRYPSTLSPAPAR